MLPHAWNVNREGNRYSVSAKWLNWLSSDGWRSIDTSIQADRTATEAPFDLQIPDSAQGVCTILANNRFSMKRHVTERKFRSPNSEPGLQISVEALTQTNSAGAAHPTDPGRWVYPNAWPGANLHYHLRHGRAVRLEKLVEIDPAAVPNGNLSYSFRVRGTGTKPFLAGKNSREQLKGTINIGDKTAFMALGDSELRGVSIRPAFAWYLDGAELIKERVRMQARVVDSETIELTKSIEPRLVAAARSAGSVLWTDATFLPRRGS